MPVEGAHCCGLDFRLVVGDIEGLGWRKSRLRVREFNARWNAFLPQIASRRHMTLGSL